MESILKIQRDQNIAKERQCWRNKTIIKVFGIRISRIILISSMLMEEERIWNAVKRNNWATGSKTNTHFALSSFVLTIHHWHQSASQPMRILDFFGQLKRIVQVKLPSARKINYQMTQKMGYVTFYCALL